MMITRITWTTRERELVLNEAMKIFLEKNEEKTNWTERLFQAQQVLPKDRHRTRSSLSGQTAVDFHRAVVAKIEQSKKQQLKQEEIKSTPIAKQEVVQHFAERINQSISLDIDSLIQQIAKNVASTLETYLIAELEQATERAFTVAVDNLKNKAATLTINKSQQAAVMPKVVICGLKPNQAGEISSEFASVFNLKFVDASDNINVLKNSLVNSHFVFMMTKFISHSHSSAVRGMNVININGGVTALKERMLHIAAEI